MCNRLADHIYEIGYHDLASGESWLVRYPANTRPAVVANALWDMHEVSGSKLTIGGLMAMLRVLYKTTMAKT